MAKVHDKYVIELAEVIKGYGNNPDVADPFRLSEFYRFYELPNIAVSQENFDRMQPLDSVQPTQSNASNTLNALDCVSRQAVRGWLVNNWDGRTKTIFGDWIENLPSAQPEIIACGYCKHYITHDKRCGYWNHGVKPVDWCSHAERREE